MTTLQSLAAALLGQCCSKREVGDGVERQVCRGFWFGGCPEGWSPRRQDYERCHGEDEP